MGYNPFTGGVGKERRIEGKEENEEEKEEGADYNTANEYNYID